MASSSVPQKLRQAAFCVVNSLLSLVAASGSPEAADPPYRPLHSKPAGAPAAFTSALQQLVSGRPAASPASDDDEDQLPAEQIPEGFLPVLVGPDYRTCYVIRAGVLSHPLLGQVLQMSAQEFGYAHQGALKLPCDAPYFEKLLDRIQCSCSGSGDALLTLPLVYSISHL